MTQIKLNQKRMRRRGGQRERDVTLNPHQKAEIPCHDTVGCKSFERDLGVLTFGHSDIWVFRHFVQAPPAPRPFNHRFSGPSAGLSYVFKS